MEESSIIFREHTKVIPTTTYATFSLYKYPAKFIPQVVSYIFEKYTQSGMSVIDPFAGNGTTGAVAKLYGLNYELWDINPLLKELHKAAISSYQIQDPAKLVRKMLESEKSFTPVWKNLLHWHPPEFVDALSTIWGYYHSLRNGQMKESLAVPLLNLTRNFSYDDQSRMKLSKSKKSTEKLDTILRGDWKNQLEKSLIEQILNQNKRRQEYWELNPIDTKSKIAAGVDGISYKLSRKKDILVTSPPYLHSQEYMRRAKLDLFWLGYTADAIKKFSDMEIPYRHVPKTNVDSMTYYEFLGKMEDNYSSDIFTKYFDAILGIFDRLKKSIRDRMFIFVGRASLRGMSIPIDTIIAEHLGKGEWVHSATIQDTIVSRRMFDYKINPATGIEDDRTKVENLVILERKKV